jgi:hypothetical protein
MITMMRGDDGALRMAVSLPFDGGLRTPLERARRGPVGELVDARHKVPAPVAAAFSRWLDEAGLKVKREILVLRYGHVFEAARFSLRKPSSIPGR